MGAKLGGKQRLIKKLLEDATGPAVCDVEATARRVGHETRPLPLTPLSPLPISPICFDCSHPAHSHKSYWKCARSLGYSSQLNCFKSVV